MVEYSMHIDSVFHALADPTRRDILERVARAELSVGELVDKYTVSFAAISKHLSVLENARLIRKRKEGRKQFVSIETEALKTADQYLARYRDMWESRYNKLDKLLQEEQRHG